MIISASRRTDIPAFYSRWLVNRFIEGYCFVPNPYNIKKATRVSLLREDVDAIVFWTRNPAPFVQHLPFLDNEGFPYFFHFSILGYPREIDLHCPCLETCLDNFRSLAEKIGSARVIWRYDPILITQQTNVNYHIERFHQIAESLNGYTRRVVISLYDPYPGHKTRMRKLDEAGYRWIDEKDIPTDDLDNLYGSIGSVASACGMSVQSCAEKNDLSRFGINHGACIDANYLQETFGVEVPSRKDPYQRGECRCIPSKDIGVYQTCLMGCSYCYATSNFDQARRNHALHDPDAPALLNY